MKLSIVIPTYNRLGQLKRVLGGIENQTCPRDQFEVLVVSDGSSDGTEAYLQSLNPPFQMRVFSQSNGGAATARNLGIAKAVGDFVLFIDDDVFPLPELAMEHLRFHAEYGDCAIVIGPMLAPPNYKMSPWVRWELDRLAEQYRDMEAGRWVPTARQFYTGNSSIARHYLVESGGFDPVFRRAEDVELAYRLTGRGLKFFFNPCAAVQHYAERSFTAWLAIPYAYGRNDVIFSHQRGQAWLISTVYKEFLTRHPLTRAVTWLCLDRPGISSIITSALVLVMETGNQLNLNRLTDMSCSGIFNLRYYQGVADGLDGREAFFNGLESCQISLLEQLEIR